MARVETLPPGFERLGSESLRVRIRFTGRRASTKVFPLAADTAAARKAQLAEAKAWAERTRRDLLGGTDGPSSEAQRTTLAQALRRYQREGLDGSASNSKVEAYRIGTILRDPIAQLTLSRLRKSDVAAFRDALIERGWARSIRLARKGIEGPGAEARLSLLDELVKLRAARSRSDDEDRLAENRGADRRH